MLKLKKRKRGINMRNLTRDEVLALRKLKGTENGRDKFFDLLDEYYKDDAEGLERIKHHREMKYGVDSVIPYAAHEKTEVMYEHFMDDFLEEIGYTKED